MVKLGFKSFGFSLVGVAILSAANFWETKDYMQWNAKEIRKILSNSPWAKKASLNFGAMRGMTGQQPPGGYGGGQSGRGLPGGGFPGSGGGGGFPGSGGGGGFPGSGGGGGFPGSGGGGGDPSGGAVARGGGSHGRTGGGQSLPSFELTIRWSSALPIKQALMRGRFGKEAHTAAEAKRFLQRIESHYVISVDGFPSRMARIPQNADQLKEITFLKRRNKDSIRPETVEIHRQEESVTLFIGFPRTNRIVLQDKNVEFEMKFGPMTMKRRFKLQDMVFNGKLEL